MGQDTPTLRYAGRTIPLGGAQTVLEALEAEGVAVPNSCRAGACQSCTMRVVSGELPGGAQVGLSPAKRELGHFLACVCRPTEDLDIADLGDSAEVSATIAEVSRTSGEVLLVRLRCASPLSYRPGQFITLLRPDGLARAYSLASVPALDGEQDLLLHVRHYPQGAMSGWLAEAPCGAQVGVRGPAGECFYVAATKDEPLLLVGTGTGLAPLYGIVRDALEQGHRGPLTLLYGARRAEDLYLRGELAALTAEHENLEVIASALEVGDAADVDGRPLDTIALERAEASRTPDLRVFLCGAPELVNGLRRRLFIAGVPLRSIFADAFLPSAPATGSSAV